MAAVRITLSVPEQLAVRIKDAAGQGTVSGWVVKVIEEYLAEGAELERQFVDSLEANPPSEEEFRRADELFEQIFPTQRGQGENVT